MGITTSVYFFNEPKAPDVAMSLHCRHLEPRLPDSSLFPLISLGIISSNAVRLFADTLNGQMADLVHSGIWAGELVVATSIS